LLGGSGLIVSDPVRTPRPGLNQVEWPNAKSFYTQTDKVQRPECDARQTSGQADIEEKG
jgi:hypothetical protein